MEYRKQRPLGFTTSTMTIQVSWLLIHILKSVAGLSRAAAARGDTVKKQK
jgi:hypothetical protein